LDAQHDWTAQAVQLVRPRNLHFLNPANSKVIAYIRQLDDESMLCVANLSRFAQPVSLDLAEYAGRTPMEVFGYKRVSADQWAAVCAVACALLFPLV